MKFPSLKHHLRFGAISAMVFCVILGLSQFALAYDLILDSASIKFSSSTFIEGKSVRIYATVSSNSKNDLRGVVRFLCDTKQIEGDQPVSVLGSQTDSVFVDWNPPAGTHIIKITLIPYNVEGDSTANNTYTKEISVAADTDDDGIPNNLDPDDDNDSVLDTADTFPLNKNESADSDGDGMGDNADTDDDNDGVLDVNDAFPLNANESVDTDADGIGNNADTDNDNDKLADIDETKLGTDPLKKDTDGDNTLDGDDVAPLDPKLSQDFDKDGLANEMDPDADNDGIKKTEDANDTNLGPKVIILNNKKPLQKLAFTNSTITFDSSESIDPDGKITKTIWSKDEKSSEGQEFTQTFEKAGKYSITATLTDDKGETREKTFSIYVIPTFAPWLLLIVSFMLVCLAIYKVFTYSKRRTRT